MEHVNFDGVNAIMVRGEKGPEKGPFFERTRQNQSVTANAS